MNCNRTSARLSDAEVPAQEQYGHRDHPQLEYQVGTSQIMLVQLIRVMMSATPLAMMASHPTQRGRNRVETMTQPQQAAKQPRATPAVGEYCLSLIEGIPGDLRVEVIGAERDSGLVSSPG